MTTGDTKADVFAQDVNTLCLFLKTEFPLDFSELTCTVELSPEVDDYEVPRWIADRSTCSITLYRVPIERLGHKLRVDQPHLRSHIEQAMFEAAGYIAGKDPFSFLVRWHEGPDPADE